MNTLVFGVAGYNFSETGRIKGDVDYGDEIRILKISTKAERIPKKLENGIFRVGFS